MAIFSNRAVLRVNLHSALQQLGNSVVNIFGAVYLLQHGVPLPWVFLSFAGLFAARLLLFRPWVPLLAEQIGLHGNLILGCVLYASLNLILIRVDGLSVWLLFFILSLAATDSLYWVSFHALYATVGDAERRGRQVAMRAMLNSLAGASAPLLSSFAIVHWGFPSLFVLAAILLGGAGLLLLGVPPVSLGQRLSFRSASKNVSWQGFWMLFGDGWTVNAHSFCWQLILFMLLKDYRLFGGILGLSVLFQSLVSLLLGHWIDRGSGLKVMMVGLAMLALSTILRCVYAIDIPRVIFCNLLFAAGSSSYGPALSTGFYNAAKKASNPFWFHLFAEMGYDLGAILALLIAAAMTFFGLNLRGMLLVSLIGYGFALAMLWKYYATHPRTHANPLLPPVENRV